MKKVLFISAAYLIILASFLNIAHITFSNINMPDMQLFISHWKEYILCGLVIVYSWYYIDSYD